MLYLPIYLLAACGSQGQGHGPQEALRGPSASLHLPFCCLLTHSAYPTPEPWLMLGSAEALCSFTGQLLLILWLSADFLEQGPFVSGLTVHVFFPLLILILPFGYCRFVDAIVWLIHTAPVASQSNQPHSLST